MSDPIVVRDLAVGTQLVLTGAEVEILANPWDGVWLFARRLSSDNDPTMGEEEEMIFAQDKVEGHQ